MQSVTRSHNICVSLILFGEFTVICERTFTLINAHAKSLNEVARSSINVLSHSLFDGIMSSLVVSLML